MPKKELARLGTEITSALAALDRSQAWLARETGLGRATISRLVNAKIPDPSGYSLAVIADVLGLDPNYLQSLAGIPVPITRGVRDPSVEYIAKRLDALPSETREVAVDAVGAVVDAVYRVQEQSDILNGEQVTYEDDKLDEP